MKTLATLIFLTAAFVSSAASAEVMCQTARGQFPMPNAAPQPGTPCGNGFDDFGVTVVLQEHSMYGSRARSESNRDFSSWRLNSSSVQDLNMRGSRGRGASNRDFDSWQPSAAASSSRCARGCEPGAGSPNFDNWRVEGVQDFDD